MGFSVYCSTTHVHCVAGTQAGKALRVTDYLSVPLGEGAVINGIITDEELLTATLLEMRQKKLIGGARVSLVADSSTIAMRTLTAPVLPKKELHAFVQRELSAYMEADTPLVCDYAVLEESLPTGGGSILAVGVPRAFLEAYVRVFTNAGYQLQNINVGLNAQVKLVRSMKNAAGETCVLAMVDGNNLVLSIFDRGKHLHANRYRLMNRFGSLGWLDEFENNISSLIQFNKGQRNNDINAIYVDGLPEEAYLQAEAGLSHYNVRVQPFPTEGAILLSGNAAKERDDAFRLGKYQYNVGSLLKK